MPEHTPPAPENNYREDHVIRLYTSFYELTGRHLIECPVKQLGEQLYYAPFALVSHDTSEDPVFNYANQAALNLFEMEWAEFTSLPSRKSAEQPLREERARLLAAVNSKGYIDDYTGIRIARSGKRFFIENATVWNVEYQLQAYGQAAMFMTWRPIE